MTVTIRIPTPLRRFTKESSRVPIEAGNVGQALEGLMERFSDLRPHLVDASGLLRNFVNVYVNGQDVRALKGDKTPLKDGDELLIVPAIAGGAQGTKLPLAPKGPDLSQQELIRYSRHLLMPQVGVEGQKRLKASSALVVGLGGLGAPIGQYLAAAGVGRIGLVDFDRIDLSNLQRQVLFSTEQIGASKAEKAKERLENLNPNVSVELHATKLTAENALKIIGDYDVVVDGTDNFPTRYLINDACVLKKKPNVYGSIFRFEGQVSVFWSEKGPCYRCLYPAPPPPGLVPSCAEGGVLGVLPGIVGSMQANEALKILLRVGDALVGRLVLFDALEMTFTTVRLHKDPKCVVCGPNPTIRALIDYEDFCGLREPEGVSDGVTVEPGEVKRMLDRKEEFVLLDVREPFEFEIAHIPGSILIPMSEVEGRMGELDPRKKIVAFCHTGQRSGMVANWLRSKGFRSARNLRGGIARWSDEIDSSIPTY